MESRSWQKKPTKKQSSILGTPKEQLHGWNMNMFFVLADRFPFFPIVFSNRLSPQKTIPLQTHGHKVSGWGSCLGNCMASLNLQRGEFPVFFFVAWEFTGCSGVFFRGKGFCMFSLCFTWNCCLFIRGSCLPF